MMSTTRAFLERRSRERHGNRSGNPSRSPLKSHFRSQAGNRPAGSRPAPYEFPRPTREAPHPSESRTYSVPAVILGLDELVGLQVARTLSERGVPVIGLARDSGHYASRTRAVRSAIIAGPGDDALLESLLSVAGSSGERPVLIPATDDYVLFVLRRRSVLADHFRIALPASNTVESLLDKVRFHRFAERLGLPVPKTFVLDSEADARAAGGAIHYPCVIKPAVKSEAWWERVRVKAIIVRNAAELMKSYTECAPHAASLLVQEWVAGPENELWTCNCYFDESSLPVATFVSRKLRQWPPYTGVASLSADLRNDEVLQQSTRLLRRAAWRGLAYVEMKRDLRTGRYLIIEANVGRPTGRSTLAEACGVEILLAMYCDLAGYPRPESLTQRYTGRKWIHLVNDLRSAFFFWRKGELTPAAWLRSLRGVGKDAVLRLTDPVTSLAYLWEVTRHAISGGRIPQRGARP